MQKIANFFSSLLPTFELQRDEKLGIIRIGRMQSRKHGKRGKVSMEVEEIRPFQSRRWLEVLDFQLWKFVLRPCSVEAARINFKRFSFITHRETRYQTKRSDTRNITRSSFFCDISTMFFSTWLSSLSVSIPFHYSAKSRAQFFHISSRLACDIAPRLTAKE